MRDLALAAELRTAMLAQLARYGFGTVAVKQRDQPTTQGAPSGPTLLFGKVSEVKYGHPQRADVWNEANGNFDHVLSIQIETTIQFAAMATQDPADLVSPLAADILKAAAAAAQSDTMLTALRTKGVGVLRVRDIRDTPVVNETGEFARNPTFDVVLTHRDEYTEAVPVVVASEVNINRV